MAMVTEKMQEQEWKLAQDINVSLDLVSATKQHLKFLAAVDRNGSWLCQDGPTLRRAIHRYNTCWIPLLAKHTDSPLFEGPLVVPLDCEWIWHCHRLNPITYKLDCEKSYGKILDNKNVVSSTQETAGKETEVVWKNLYPNEAFFLDPNVVVNDNDEDKVTEARKFTEYDLVFSVQRQSQFFSQVSEPHMSNDLYLEGAVARYKGFLHLIKRNMERNINDFLAPTYDIDLIWHTHQLHPISYSNDLQDLLGMVLGHDDTVTDRTKGQKLDVGFTTSINSWADMFGTRYKRAGALHKFSTPERKIISLEAGQKDMHLTELKTMEVMLEFVNVKGIPEEHKLKQLFVSYSKTQPDALFMGKRILPISSKFEEKVASFQCQPTGMFLFELVAWSPSNKELLPTSETLGSCSISLKDLLLPESGLMIEKWMKLVPSTNNESTTPISLRMAVSVTPPNPTPLSDKLISIETSVCAKACTASNRAHISTTPSGHPCANPCGRLSTNTYVCINDSKASPCGPPSSASACAPFTGSNASPCGPPTTVSSPCDPPTTVSSPCGPPTTVSSPCGPPTTVSSPCGPPTTVSSPCGPPTTVSSPCGPPTTVSSPCGPPLASAYVTGSKASPPSTKASPCGPPTTLSSPCGPPSASAWVPPTGSKSSPCGPPSTLASPCGPPTVLASPCGPPSAVASPCGPPSVLASPCGPPSALASPCGPPIVLSSPCGPPSALASPCGPPTVLASPCGPPSTLASPCGPPSVLASPCDPPSMMTSPPSTLSSPCGPPSVLASPCGPPSVLASPCGPPSVLASPCGPPSVLASPCGPPYALASLCGPSYVITSPSSALSSPCGPPSVLSSPCGPPSVLASPCGPPSVLASPCGPPSALASPCGPPSTLASPCGPPSALASPCGPPSALASPCGPPSALASPCGPPSSLASPCGPPSASIFETSSKASLCDIPSALASPCGPPSTNAYVCATSSKANPCGITTTDSCACATNVNVCDANMCVRIIGANDCGSNACPGGISCA